MHTCNLLEPEVLCYVLSFIFQIAGAILLIIKHLGKTEERIIDEYYPGQNLVPAENEPIFLEKEKVKECVIKIYHNRAAFLFITIGYVLAIFGNQNACCKMCILDAILTFTLVLIISEQLLVCIIANLIYKGDLLVTHDQVKNKTHSAISKNYIDSLFKNQANH